MTCSADLSLGHDKIVNFYKKKIFSGVFFKSFVVIKIIIHDFPPSSLDPELGMGWGQVSG